MFLYLSDKLISNNFSGVKIDFRFHKKSEQLAFMQDFPLQKSTMRKQRICGQLMLIYLTEVYVMDIET